MFVGETVPVIVSPPSATATTTITTTTIIVTGSHRAVFTASTFSVGTSAQEANEGEGGERGSGGYKRSGSPARAGRWSSPTDSVGGGADLGEQGFRKHCDCPVSGRQSNTGIGLRTIDNVNGGGGDNDGCHGGGGGGVGFATRGPVIAAAMLPVTATNPTTSTNTAASTTGDTATAGSVTTLTVGGPVSSGGLVGLAGLGVAAAGATRGIESGTIVENARVGPIDGGTTSGFVDLDPYEIWNPEKAYAVRGICLVIFGTVGVLLNVFMIIAIVPNRRLRTVRNILLVHLGVVGLASSLTLTLTAAIVIFHGVWLGGRVVCHAYGFTLSVFTFVSVWTITALSWDKYRTIASPLHHSLTASFGKMTACFIVFWLGAVSLSIPPFFGANQFVFDKDMAICMIDFSNAQGVWYMLLYIASAFLLPFVLITYCYLHIFRIARNQSSRIAATMVRMVSVIQAPISSAPQTALSIKGTKAISTILQLMGAFALTYLPFSVILLLRMSFDIPLERVAVVLVTTLFQAAPLTNAAVYGVRNKILRASFYRYTRRKVQEFCYRDRRRGSVRSVTKRSSCALRLSLLHKRCITSGAMLPNEFGQSSNPIPGLRRTQSYPTKTIPEINGMAVGMSRTISGTYQHSLIGLNEVNSLTPVD